MVRESVLDTANVSEEVNVHQGLRGHSFRSTIVERKRGQEYLYPFGFSNRSCSIDSALPKRPVDQPSVKTLVREVVVMRISRRGHGLEARQVLKSLTENRLSLFS